MTRRTTLLALAFAALSPFLSGCACYRPLFPRLRCLLSCPAGAPSPVVGAVPVGAPILGGGHPPTFEGAGFPVGAPVGQPGCANCGPGGSPIGMGTPIQTVPVQFDPHQGAMPAGFPGGGFPGNYQPEAIPAGAAPIATSPVGAPGAMGAGYAPYQPGAQPDPYGGYPTQPSAAPQPPAMGPPTMPQPQAGLPLRSVPMGAPVVVQGSGYPQPVPYAMPGSPVQFAPQTPAPQPPYTGPSTPLPAPMPVTPMPPQQ